MRMVRRLQLAVHAAAVLLIRSRGGWLAPSPGWGWPIESNTGGRGQVRHRSRFGLDHKPFLDWKIGRVPTLKIALSMFEHCTSDGIDANTSM